MHITAIYECHAKTPKGKKIVLKPGVSGDVDANDGQKLIRLKAAFETSAEKKTSTQTRKPAAKKTTKRKTAVKKTAASEAEQTENGESRRDLID